MKTVVDSEKETAKLARDLAASLQKNEIILLHGTLGMGKTVFARSLIRALTQKQELNIPSPTFTLLQIYETPDIPIYHFDLYRLETPEEIFDLGWEEAISDGITIVEWPERLGAYKPSKRLDIKLTKVEDNHNSREILIERTHES